jgi:low temperature requirement protein LtrA
MIRLLASLVVNLIANAIGLIAAAAIVAGFSINGLSFFVAVVIFTLTEGIAGPLITKIAVKNAPALLGGIALVTTFVGLIITRIFTSGLTINGAKAWLLSTLVVWLCALLAQFILPLLIFKKILAKHKQN